jgi:hypothetical protein
MNSSLAKYSKTYPIKDSNYSPTSTTQFFDQNTSPAIGK